MTIRQTQSAISALILSGCVASCGAAVNGFSDGSNRGDGAFNGDAIAFDAGPDAAPGAGLPCDVYALVNTYCVSCHSAGSSAAPMAMQTYADLMAPAPTDHSQTVAQMAITRMQSATSPMPPAPSPAVPAADIAAFQAWVTAGSQPTTCDTNLPPDPLGASPTCTSATMWTRGTSGSSRMEPGQACISCHNTTGGEAPTYSLAGTVFPTGHEPNNCNGANPATLGAIQIEVTDMLGNVIRMIPNSAGNFFSGAPFTPPYTARVLYMGRERRMATPQTDGDCNTCHTQSGTSSAPGRITLP